MEFSTHLFLVCWIAYFAIIQLLPADEPRERFGFFYQRACQLVIALMFSLQGRNKAFHFWDTAIEKRRISFRDRGSSMESWQAPHRARKQLPW